MYCTVLVLVPDLGAQRSPSPDAANTYVLPAALLKHKGSLSSHIRFDPPLLVQDAKTTVAATYGTNSTYVEGRPASRQSFHLSFLS
jgi:hypothetical protein